MKRTIPALGQGELPARIRRFFGAGTPLGVNVVWVARKGATFCWEWENCRWHRDTTASSAGTERPLEQLAPAGASGSCRDSKKARLDTAAAWGIRKAYREQVGTGRWYRLGLEDMEAMSSQLWRDLHDAQQASSSLFGNEQLSSGFSSRNLTCVLRNIGRRLRVSFGTSRYAGAGVLPALHGTQQVTSSCFTGLPRSLSAASQPAQQSAARALPNTLPLHDARLIYKFPLHDAAAINTLIESLPCNYICESRTRAKLLYTKLRKAIMCIKFPEGSI